MAVDQADYTPVLVPKRVTDQVYDALKQAIIALDFPPDAVLVEEELARRYGTSKTPVRAALAKLGEEGFVVATPHKETRVARLSLRDLWELFEAKNAVEGYCVRRLAGRLRPEQLANLQTTLRRCEEAMATSDYRWWIQETNRFHAQFVEYLGNRRFVRLLANLRDHLQRGRGLFIAAENRERLQTMHRYHCAILEAVERGDGSRAEELLHEHSEVFFGYLREICQDDEG